MHPTHNSRICIITLICDEECCTIDCCKGTYVEYELVEESGDCCVYDITVVNNSDCEKRVDIEGFINAPVPANKNRTHRVNVCEEKRVKVVDYHGNTCYEDVIDCSCCSLVEVNVELKNTAKDCCFYTIEMINRSDCVVMANDKFGQTSIIMEPGETRTSLQRACGGNDTEFHLYMFGETEPCETIILPAVCE